MLVSLSVTYNSSRFIDHPHLLKMLRRMWILRLPKPATEPASTSKHFQLSRTPKDASTFAFQIPFVIVYLSRNNRGSRFIVLVRSVSVYE